MTNTEIASMILRTNTVERDAIKKLHLDLTKQSREFLFLWSLEINILRCYTILIGCLVEQIVDLLDIMETALPESKHYTITMRETAIKGIMGELKKENDDG